jgi:hypothetical protein
LPLPTQIIIFTPMTTLEEARTVLNKLSVADRQSVIEWLTHDSEEVAPGIFRTPGVCGGEACVRDLRLPVSPRTSS